MSAELVLRQLNRYIGPLTQKTKFAELSRIGEYGKLADYLAMRLKDHNVIWVRHHLYSTGMEILIPKPALEVGLEVLNKLKDRSELHIRNKEQVLPELLIPEYIGRWGFKAVLNRRFYPEMQIANSSFTQHQQKRIVEWIEELVPMYFKYVDYNWGDNYLETTFYVGLSRLTRYVLKQYHIGTRYTPEQLYQYEKDAALHEVLRYGLFGTRYTPEQLYQYEKDAALQEVLRHGLSWNFKLKNYHALVDCPIESKTLGHIQWKATVDPQGPADEWRFVYMNHEETTRHPHAESFQTPPVDEEHSLDLAIVYSNFDTLHAFYEPKPGKEDLTRKKSSELRRFFQKLNIVEEQGRNVYFDKNGNPVSRSSFDEGFLIPKKTGTRRDNYPRNFCSQEKSQEADYYVGHNPHRGRARRRRHYYGRFRESRVVVVFYCLSFTHPYIHAHTYAYTGCLPTGSINTIHSGAEWIRNCRSGRKDERGAGRKGIYSGGHGECRKL